MLFFPIELGGTVEMGVQCYRVRVCWHLIVVTVPAIKTAGKGAALSWTDLLKKDGLNRELGLN